MVAAGTVKALRLATAAIWLVAAIAAWLGFILRGTASELLLAIAFTAAALAWSAVALIAKLRRPLPAHPEAVP
jgi:hypothetical protein